MRDIYDFISLNSDHRDHPVVGVILYMYCPAAAGWWRAGVSIQQEAPYDVVHHVLETYALGDVTLKRAMELNGVEGMFDSVKTYLGHVEDYRRQMPNVPAPELLPSFTGGVVSANLRFGHGDSFDKYYGGDWRNILEFARVWRFVLQDWQREIIPNEDEDYRIEKKILWFRAKGVNIPLKVPVWVWVRPNGIQSVIGYISRDGLHDQVQLYMRRYAAPDGKLPWPILPQVAILDPVSGAVVPYGHTVEKDVMESLLAFLGGVVKNGPYPPSEALGDGRKCASCLFRQYCYDRSGVLSPMVLRLFDKNASFAQETML